jgi:hypothetical protein
MAHIRLPEALPGIVGPLTFSPDTAKPLQKSCCAVRTLSVRRSEK